MNNPLIQDEIKLLKIGYIFHLFLYFMLSICHLLVFIKLYKISKVVYGIIFSETIINIMSIFFPIFFYIILACKRINERHIKTLEIISKFLLIIFLVNSLLTSGAIGYYSSLIPTFYRDCPYNYDVNDIPKLFFDDLSPNKNSIKKDCNDRRFYSLNYDRDVYICNFIDKEYEIFNFEKTKDDIIYDNLLKYINYCMNYTIFFKN